MSETVQLIVIEDDDYEIKTGAVETVGLDAIMKVLLIEYDPAPASVTAWILYCTLESDVKPVCVY